MLKKSTHSSYACMYEWLYARSIARSRPSYVAKYVRGFQQPTTDPIRNARVVNYIKQGGKGDTRFLRSLTKTKPTNRAVTHGTRTSRRRTILPHDPLWHNSMTKTIGVTRNAGFRMSKRQHAAKRILLQFPRCAQSPRSSAQVTGAVGALPPPFT